MSRLEQMLAFLDEDPDDSFTRYAVALEYKSAGEIARAVECLSELRRRDANYLPTYYMLGELLSGQESFDAAEEVYRAGMKLATETGDLHTRSELEEALDEMESLR